MAQALILTFRRGTSLVEESDSRVTLTFPAGTLTLDAVLPGLRGALRRLAAGGETEDVLGDLVLKDNGISGLATWYYHRLWFSKLNLLCYSVVEAGRAIVTAVPMTPRYEPQTSHLGPDTPYRLSRFSFCRRDGDDLILETPYSPVRFILHGRAAAVLLAELARPHTVRELCALVSYLGPDAVEASVSLFASAGVVAAVGEDGALPEDSSPTLAQWEFHDLLFHTRNRIGRHDYPLGGTFRFRGRLPPLPALKPRMSDDIVPLYRPDLTQVEKGDLPLTRVLKARRSIRKYGSTPITARQLGEFLYRVARVDRIIEPDSARGRHYQVTHRPYPSGGATYDLELYLTINQCQGLPSGLYHYDPVSHNLCRLAGRNAHVEAVLRGAQGAAKMSFQPQILITLTSRFQRLSWKYSGIAYATTLKNVGVLYQTMYIVATGMGLAPCALGSGNSDLFAEATGTDYFAESSVGEFLLGSSPSG